MTNRHKFLEKFYKYTTFSHQFNTSRFSRKKKKKLKKIKRKYNVDLRECWYMDLSFYTWLYEHIKAYEKFAPVNMDDPNLTFEFKGKSYTQREMMHKIIKRLEIYFKTLDKESISDKKQTKINEIIPLWQKVMPAMWW